MLFESFLAAPKQLNAILNDQKQQHLDFVPCASRKQPDSLIHPRASELALFMLLVAHQTKRKTKKADQLDKQQVFSNYKHRMQK